MRRALWPGDRAPWLTLSRGARHKTRKLLFWTVLLFAAVLWSTLHPFWLDTVGRWLLQAAGLPERCGSGRQRRPPARQTTGLPSHPPPFVRRPWKAATVLTTLLLHQALGQGPIFLLSLSTVVASVALL